MIQILHIYHFHWLRTPVGFESVFHADFVLQDVLLHLYTPCRPQANIWSRLSRVWLQRCMCGGVCLFDVCVVCDWLKLLLGLPGGQILAGKTLRLWCSISSVWAAELSLSMLLNSNKKNEWERGNKSGILQWQTFPKYIEGQGITVSKNDGVGKMVSELGFLILPAVIKERLF